MASGIFLRLAARDPYAFDRLRRLAQRSMLLVGIGGSGPGRAASGPDAITGPEPGFPGDTWLFSTLLGLLVLGAYASLLFQARPPWAEAWWVKWPFSVVGAAAAVLTWVLGSLRQSPSASVETLPDAHSTRPLRELRAFARAKAAQLRAHARLQQAVALGLGAVLLGVVGFCAVLHVLGAAHTAEWLAALAVLLGVYLTLDWQPFASARNHRRLAEESAVTARMLTRALEALEALDASEDPARVPEVHAEREWRVVRDVLDAGPAWVARAD